MIDGELILFIIKLVLGGVAAFLAILLWSKMRDTAWMCLVVGVVFSYAGVVFEMMSTLGLTATGEGIFFGVSLAKLFFAVLPSVFYIIAFVLMIIRSK